MYVLYRIHAAIAAHERRTGREVVLVRVRRIDPLFSEIADGMDIPKDERTIRHRCLLIGRVAIEEDETLRESEIRPFHAGELVVVEDSVSTAVH